MPSPTWPSNSEGDSLPALFDAATHPLIESLADPASWQQTIELEEPDIDTLLFEWLNRLVYLKDAGRGLHHVTLALQAAPHQSAWRLHPN